MPEIRLSSVFDPRLSKDLWETDCTVTISCILLLTNILSSGFDPQISKDLRKIDCIVTISCMLSLTNIERENDEGRGP